LKRLSANTSERPEPARYRVPSSGPRFESLASFTARAPNRTGSKEVRSGLSSRNLTEAKKHNEHGGLAGKDYSQRVLLDLGAKRLSDARASRIARPFLEVSQAYCSAGTDSTGAEAHAECQRQLLRRVLPTLRERVDLPGEPSQLDVEFFLIDPTDWFKIQSQPSWRWHSDG